MRPAAKPSTAPSNRSPVTLESAHTTPTVANVQTAATTSHRTTIVRDRSPAFMSVDEPIASGRFELDRYQERDGDTLAWGNADSERERFWYPNEECAQRQR
jgi:hypothetical protein